MIPTWLVVKPARLARTGSSVCVRLCAVAIAAMLASSASRARPGDVMPGESGVSIAAGGGAYRTVFVELNALGRKLE